LKIDLRASGRNPLKHFNCHHISEKSPTINPSNLSNLAHAIVTLNGNFQGSA